MGLLVEVVVGLGLLGCSCVFGFAGSFLLFREREREREREILIKKNI